MRQKAKSSRDSSSRTSSSRSTPRSKTGKKAKVDKVMKEYKTGDLHSGHGGKVKSRKQAIAIAMHESGQSRKQHSTHA